MATDNPQSSSGQRSSPPEIGGSRKSTSVMIARIVGIMCVAGGFIFGIEGLDQSDSYLLPTALGLIVAGLVAQVFALARSWYLYSQRNV